MHFENQCTLSKLSRATSVQRDPEFYAFKVLTCDKNHHKEKNSSEDLSAYHYIQGLHSSELS